MKGREQQQSQTLKASEVHQFTAIPGLLMIHTNKGVALLHPETLEVIDIEIKGSSSPAPDDGVIHYQFEVDKAHFDVVKVWDIRHSQCGGVPNTTRTRTDLKTTMALDVPSSEVPSGDDDMNDLLAPVITGDSVATECQRTLRGVVTTTNGGKGCIESDVHQVDYGSCLAAFAVDNRLLVVRVEPR